MRCVSRKGGTSSGCTVDAAGVVDAVDTVDVVDSVDVVDAVDEVGGTHDTLRAPLKIDAQRARVVSTAQSVGYAHVTTTSSFQSSSARTTLSTERNAINTAHKLAQSSSVSPWESPDTVGCRCAVAVPGGVVSHSECPRAFFLTTPSRPSPFAAHNTTPTPPPHHAVHTPRRTRTRRTAHPHGRYAHTTPHRRHCNFPL